jgi:hypothetical protein
MRRYSPHLPLAILAAAFLAVASLSFARSNVFLEHVEVFSASQTLTYALGVLTMCVGYGLLVFDLRNGAGLSKRSWRGWAAFFLLLCLATPPFLSRDVVAYVIAGKEALAGMNPYLTPLSAFDAAWAHELRSLVWMGFPTMYGPLFVLFAALAMLAPTHGLLAAVFAFKIANAGLFLVSVALMAKLVARMGLPDWTVAAYAFNPAILINVVLEGHNDILVAVCLLSALCLGLKGARVSGAASLGAAIASKFYPVLLLPMVVFDRGRLREKAMRLGAAAVVVLAAAPFGFPFLTIVDGIRAQASLPCLYACSPFVAALERVFGADVPAARLITALALYAVIAWRFLAAPRDASGASRAAYIFWTLGVFFFVQIRWLGPWYLVVLLPFGLLLSGRRAYLALTLLLTAFSLLQYA